MAGFVRLGWRSWMGAAVVMLACSSVWAGDTSGLSVTLQWDPNPEPDLQGYYLYRSQESGQGYVKLNTDPVPDTIFVDTGLLEGTPYYYVCTAVSSSGLESGFSNQVQVLLDPTNSPPEAVADVVAILEDEAVILDVLANDIDPDGDPLIVSSFTQPAFGVVTAVEGGLSYVPAPDFNGPDSFAYQVNDGRGQTATATVSIAVAAVNDPPQAVDDAVITGETQISIAVLENDSDVEGDPLAIESVAGGLGGISHDGTSVSYSAPEGFSGIDTFSYVVTDGQGGSASASVTVDVGNNAPEAVDDSSSIDEDQAVTIAVLANDTDPDGDSLTVAEFTQPDNGAVVLLPEGLRYTPRLDFNGLDTFQYSVTDGRGEQSTASVSIDVAPVNDEPTARRDQVRLCRRRCSDQSSGGGSQLEAAGTIVLDVLANDSDPDGDTLTIDSVGEALGGTAVSTGDAIEYTLDDGFSGVDTLTYTVSDGNGGSASSTIRITVDVENRAPVARDDWSSTRSGHAVAINLLFNDFDPDGDLLTIASVTSAVGGEAEITGEGSVRFTADSDFTGTAGFGYVLSDGELEVGAQVQVDVTELVSSSLVFPLSAQTGQSTALDSSMVGIAILNGSAAEDDVSLNHLSSNGSVIDTRQLGVPLAPQGQQAFLTSEVASLGSDSAFLSVESLRSALHGLMTVVDDRVTRMDSVTGQVPPGRRLYLHQLRSLPDDSSVVALFNPSSAVAEITFRLYSPDGELLAREQPVLAPRGSMRGSLNEIFANLEEFGEAYARIDSSVAIHALAVHGNDTTFTAEAARPNDPIEELFAAHFYFSRISGDYSRLRLLNPGGAPVQITIAAFDDSGNQLLSEELILQNGQLLAEDVDELLDFSLIEGDEVSGYLRLRADSFLGGTASVIGSMEFSVFQGRAATSLPLTRFGPERLVFPHLAQSDGGAVFTGVALLNPTDQRSAVRIEAFTPDGILSAFREVELGAGARLVDVLTSDKLFGPVFEQTGGHLHISSSHPLIGLALIGSAGGGFLSAVEGQTVLSTAP